MEREVKSPSVIPTITGRELTGSHRFWFLTLTMVSSPAQDLPDLCPFTTGYRTLKKKKKRLKLKMSNPQKRFFFSPKCMNTGTLYP